MHSLYTVRSHRLWHVRTRESYNPIGSNSFTYKCDAPVKNVLIWVSIIDCVKPIVFYLVEMLKIQTEPGR